MKTIIKYTLILALFLTVQSCKLLGGGDDNGTGNAPSIQTVLSTGLYFYDIDPVDGTFRYSIARFINGTATEQAFVWTDTGWVDEAEYQEDLGFVDTTIFESKSLVLENGAWVELIEKDDTTDGLGNVEFNSSGDMINNIGSFNSVIGIGRSGDLSEVNITVSDTNLVGFVAPTAIFAAGSMGYTARWQIVSEHYRVSFGSRDCSINQALESPPGMFSCPGEEFSHPYVRSRSLDTLRTLAELRADFDSISYNTYVYPGIFYHFETGTQNLLLYENHDDDFSTDPVLLPTMGSWSEKVVGGLTLLMIHIPESVLEGEETSLLFGESFFIEYNGLIYRGSYIKAGDLAPEIFNAREYAWFNEAAIMSVVTAFEQHQFVNPRATPPDVTGVVKKKMKKPGPISPAGYGSEEKFPSFLN